MCGSDMGDEDVESSGGEEVKVIIRGRDWLKFFVHSTLNTTVGYFKSIVSQKCGIPAEQQRLIYKGRTMKDDQTLSSYGLENDQTVYLARVSAPFVTTYSVPTDYTLKAGIGVSKSGLDSYSQSGSFPGIKMMRKMIEDPEIVKYIFTIPAVRDLFNNPQTVCNMLVSKHRIDDIVHCNPEVADILTDHNTLRLIWNTVQHEVIYAMRNNKTMNISSIGHENTIPLPNPMAFTAGIIDRNSSSSGNPTTNAVIDSPSEGSPNSMLDLTSSNPSTEYPEDPIVEKTIGDMLRNNQHLVKMFDFAPSLQNVLDSNPQIRDVMQHPEFIRLLATPPAVNALLIYHKAVKDQAAEDATKSHDGRTGEGEVTAAGALERLIELFVELATHAGIIHASESTLQDSPKE